MTFIFNILGFCNSITQSLSNYHNNNYTPLIQPKLLEEKVLYVHVYNLAINNYEGHLSTMSYCMVV